MGRRTAAQLVEGIDGESSTQTARSVLQHGHRVPLWRRGAQQVDGRVVGQNMLPVDLIEEALWVLTEEEVVVGELLVAPRDTQVHD